MELTNSFCVYVISAFNLIQTLYCLVFMRITSIETPYVFATMQNRDLFLTEKS